MGGDQLVEPIRSGRIPERRGLILVRVGQDLAPRVRPAGERRILRPPAARGVLGGQAARGDLARLDVRLIERIHTEDRARHGRRDLPAEELAGDVVAVRERQAHDGLARRLEAGERRVLAGVLVAVEVQGNEDPVVVVDGGSAERLPVYGKDPGSPLARGFGQQLLEPRAEAADRRRQGERDLVAPLPGAGAEQQAESDPGIACRRHPGRAGPRHPFGGGQQPAGIEAHRGGRHHPERRQGRESSADARLAPEHGPVPGRRSPVVERRPRIRDRDEARAGRIGTDPPGHPREEVALEETRLQRRARLARHHEQRAPDIELLLERTDLGWVGGIQDPEVRCPGDVPEGLAQHFRAEARAAHSEQPDVAEALRGYRAAEPAQGIESCTHPGGRVEPAQPALLAGAGPERRVPAPEARRAVPALPLGDRVGLRRPQLRRQPPAVHPRLPVCSHRRPSGAGPSPGPGESRRGVIVPPPPAGTGRCAVPRRGTVHEGAPRVGPRCLAVGLHAVLRAAVGTGLLRAAGVVGAGAHVQ